MWVGEEEKTRAGVNLEGQRDVGELVFCTAKHVGTDDKVSMVVHAYAVMVTQGSTHVEAAADKPIETVATGILIHEIGVESEHNRNSIILIVHDEAVTQVELDGEVVGGESFEGDTIHEANGTTDGIVVRGCIAACLAENSGAAHQS